MTEKERLQRVLNDLCNEGVLKPGHWVLAGSGCIIMHDLQRTKSMGDIDIFMATRDWVDTAMKGSFTGAWKVFTTDPNDQKRRCDPPYLYRTMWDIEVNIFSQWRVRGIGDIDVNFWVHNAEDVEGWPCVPLRLLFDWKRAVGRAKDIEDIHVLARYLDGEEA